MNLDGKCLVILNYLEEGSHSVWKPALYEITKPTQQRGLDKRLQEMEQAGIIEKGMYISPNPEFQSYYVTHFGIDIAETLKGANQKTLDILHFMQDNHNFHFVPSTIAEKMNLKTKDVEKSIRKLIKDGTKVGWIGTQGEEGLYQYIC